jgi:hypothetical protein
MRVTNYPKLSITQNDGGLKIRSGHKDGVYLNFGFDGKYERNKRNYKIYAGPVYIQKRCNFHPLIGKGSIPVILKPRSIGIATGTTLDNMTDTSCQYEFSLFGDSQGNYGANMTAEYLYWHDDKEFWHVNTYFSPGYTMLYHASFEQKLDDVLRLKIPAANLKNVKNKDQLIEKMKLYTLFS